MSFRPLLSAAEKLYGFGTNIRNYLYDRGIFRFADLGRPTISIGNITAGGTGKTPIAAAVAGILAERGENVCILTRGYGRKDQNERVVVSDGKNVLADARTGGDEPVELANRLLGKAIVIADANRVSAAAWAIENFDVSVFVLDDGFQHRKAKRDLDIVLIDATNPFGGGMIPAGTLREPLANLKRADAIIITRSDLIDSTGELVEKLRAFDPNAPIFTAKNSITKIRDLKSGDSLSELPQRTFAFCALGNPNSFFELLKLNDCEPVGIKAFRDHYFYSENDITELTTEAKKAGADSLITTAKDAVKLPPTDFPVYVVEIEPLIESLIETGESFRDLIIRPL